MFEKKLPYTEEGRWYHIFIESDGTTTTVTSSDIDVSIVDNKVLKCPKDFHITDIKFDINTVEGAGETYQCVNNLAVFNDGSQGVDLVSSEYFDYLTLYLFGYF